MKRDRNEKKTENKLLEKTQNSRYQEAKKRNNL